MRMMIDISLGVLDRYGPLVIKARRKEDASICQEKPVGVGEAHIDMPPGSTVVAGTRVAEHCATLCTYLNYVHWQIELFNDTGVGSSQLLREIVSMGVRLGCEDLCKCR